MSYVRFGLMILTSTLVMFLLMYLNTYALEHVFFSETRAYMAVMMGATMAFVMLAFMLGMYTSKAMNIAIFAGAAVVFALTLWLVRSQVTVSGTSFMRAMIPHHSIAVMTSGRAQLNDLRVRKLADEIIAAQEREIAEMRFLIANISSGGPAVTRYQDPPAEPGSVEDALANTLVGQLDLTPMPLDEANLVLQSAPECTFRYTRDSDPILWVSELGSAAIKLNGVLVALEREDAVRDGATGFAAEGINLSARALGNASDWRQNAELVFELDTGLRVGYRGFHECATGSDPV